MSVSENDELMEDLAGEIASLPPDRTKEDKLEQLQEYGAQALAIEEQLTTLAERVQMRKDKLNKLLGKDMVELMTEVGVDSVTVRGRTFQVEDYYHASIKSDGERRDEAFDWLETHEAGDLISWNITITLGKDSTEQVDRICEWLRLYHQEAIVEVERGVPWKRLTSWFKEQMIKIKSWTNLDEPPPSIPLDLLGATTGRVVKLAKLRVPKK